MNKVYEIVTNRIIAELEKGVVPWRMPWKQAGPPMNLVSRKPYRGLNIITLSMQGYSSKYWLTFNQARQLGGRIKSWSKATPVILWRWIVKKENGIVEETCDEDADKTPFLKYYNVFNLDQVDGIYPPDDDEKLEFNPIEKAEAVVGGYKDGPVIEETGNQACYIPNRDVIQIPRKERFVSVAEYYSTLFHEAIHSTGNASRLNRHKEKENHRFAGEDYSREELCAELGACFLCSHAGICTKALNDNAASYLAHWLQALKNDKRLIVHAASQAQKAADYILGNTYERD